MIDKSKGLILTCKISPDTRTFLNYQIQPKSSFTTPRTLLLRKGKTKVTPARKLFYQDNDLFLEEVISVVEDDKLSLRTSHTVAIVSLFPNAAT